MRQAGEARALAWLGGRVTEQWRDATASTIASGGGDATGDRETSHRVARRWSDRKAAIRRAAAVHPERLCVEEQRDGRALWNGSGTAVLLEPPYLVRVCRRVGRLLRIQLPLRAATGERGRLLAGTVSTASMTRSFCGFSFNLPGLSSYTSLAGDQGRRTAGRC